MKRVTVWVIFPMLILIAPGCTLKGTVKEITDTTSNITGTTSGRTWFTEDGMPNIGSCMAQGKFWNENMKMVSGTVKEEQLFDLSPAVEANQALAKNNPFG